MSRFYSSLSSSPGLMWERVFPNAWLLFTLEGDHDSARNAGHTGYEDRADEVYRYDSNVGNSKHLAVGDIIVLRSRKSLIGIARIERIDASPGKKQLNRCPYCNKTSIKKRKQKLPEFRCDKCRKEFEHPLIDHVDVTNYSAWYKDSYLPCPNAIPISLLLKSCLSEVSQLSIRRMVLEELIPLLRSIPTSAFTHPTVEVPAESEIEDSGESQPEFDGGDESEIVVTPDGELIEIREENGHRVPDPEWMGVTEGMIPLFSEHPDVMDSDENRLKVLVDGASARCFINDGRMGSPKIVILFDKPHPDWVDYFTTKYFRFEEPGAMKWGNRGESMQILAPSVTSEHGHSQTAGSFSLIISATQLRKSTINANKRIRTALLENQLVDFDSIAPGRKIRKPCSLVFGGETIETRASFLIPKRRGDTSPEPRFWPYKLNKYAKPDTRLYFLATATRLIVSDSKTMPRATLPPPAYASRKPKPPEHRAAKKKTKKSRIPRKVAETAADTISSHLGISPVRKSAATYASLESGLAFTVQASSFIEREKKYWYGFRTVHYEFLRDAPESYACFVCGTENDTIFAIPFLEFSSMTDEMSMTNFPEGDSRSDYWHVDIRPRDGKFILWRKKDAERIDITDYLI
jgi:hypothetical protein